jgi:hypothetical protein
MYSAFTKEKIATLVRSASAGEFESMLQAIVFLLCSTVRSAPRSQVASILRAAHIMLELSVEGAFSLYQTVSSEPWKRFGDSGAEVWSDPAVHDLLDYTSIECLRV